MRKLSLMGVLVAANFATAGLGRYIDGENGKLAISNFPPVLFLLVAIPSFFIARNSVTKGFVGFLLAFNALAWLSFLMFLFRFGWSPNFPVLFFQEIEILFSFLLIWYGRTHFDEFLFAARYGTMISVLISAWYGAQQITIVGALFLLFGMDDKSQAAVLFCCQAFFLIWYFGRPLDMAMAGLLMLMSFFSLSRLPFLFLPILFVAVVKRSRLAATLSVLAVGGIAAAALSSGISFNQVFKVFDRLSSVETVATEDATSAHFLLLRSALQIKFTDAYAFLSGIGPGDFSKALTSFPISKSELEAVDPLLIEKARVNRAPVHSTPLSALIDYSLPVFGIIVFLFLKAARYLVRGGHRMELVFLATLFAASMFYSIHNKTYAFLICAAIAVMITQKEDSQSADPVQEGAEVRPLSDL